MTEKTRRLLAVVTGASSGIGKELAELLARGQHDLVLVARRADRLEALCASLSQAHGVNARPLAADLARAEECDRVLLALAPDRDRLGVLVNNAGFGTHGFFHEVPAARDLEMIDVNIRALTHLVKGVLPWMRANGRGRIMNVASVASFQPGPLMAVYYASKAYVLSLSEALANECRGSGVTVTASCPGPTYTEFAQAAGIASNARPVGATPMTSAAVARISYEGMMRGVPVVVTGLWNRVAVMLSRWLPRSWVMWYVRRVQEARRGAGEGSQAISGD